MIERTTKIRYHQKLYIIHYIIGVDRYIEIIDIYTATGLPAPGNVVDHIINSIYSTQGAHK